jgi:hypothetical protein
VLASLGLVLGMTACSLFSGTHCQAPLSQAQCDSAVKQARAWVQANPSVVNGNPDGVRFPDVSSTCATATCTLDNRGMATVSIVDASGHSPGDLQVCVDDTVCVDTRPWLIAPLT